MRFQFFHYGNLLTLTLLFINSHFVSAQTADGLQIGLSALTTAGGSTVGNDSLAKLQAGGHDPNRLGFTVQNVELSFNAAVDPFFDAQANIIYLISANGESVVELEEAFFLSRALPAGLQIKAGQFYTEFGRFNNQHPHTWAFVDQPVIASRLLGADGLRSQGARLSWLMPASWYSEIYFTVQNANGETTHSFMGEGSAHSHGHEQDDTATFAEYEIVDRPVNGLEDFLYATRWLNGLDLSETLSANFGISGLYGPNNTGLKTETLIYGLDIYLKWQPARTNKGFPFVAWHTEWMHRDYQAGDNSHPEPQTLKDSGFFSYLQWGFKPAWVFALRYEHSDAEDPHHDEHAEQEIDFLRDKRQRLSSNLSYYPSEFSKIRLQYNYDRADHLDESAHSLWLQFEYTIGAHMAHNF